MKKFLTLALTAVFGAVLMSGCATMGGGAGGGNGGGGRADIVIGTAADLITMDPHGSNDAPSSDINSHVFSTLVRTSNQMEIVSDLAESWENLSPTEWQFNLRQGVLWHDGTPFTASDVRFSLLRQQDMPQVSHLVAAISNVHVIDDYTVIIETYEPFGPILANLAHVSTRIVPEHAVTYFGDDGFAENPIGTGPMRFVSWTPGVETVLERFDDYFGGMPLSERLTFRVITDGPARTIALETGEVDMVLVVEHVDVQRIQDHAELYLPEAMSNRVEWLSFNLNREPFDNVLVRRAIAHALDRESLNIVGYMGRSDIAHSFTGPTVFGYNPNVEYIEFNPDLARELLAEAGFPDGFSTTLWSNGDARNRKAQTIQSNLRDIGIMVGFEKLEWAAYLDRPAQGNQ